MSLHELAKLFARVVQPVLGRRRTVLRLLHLLDQDRQLELHDRATGQLVINGTPIALVTQGDRAVVFIGVHRLLAVSGDEPLQALERVLPFVHGPQSALAS